MACPVRHGRDAFGPLSQAEALEEEAAAGCGDLARSQERPVLPVEITMVSWENHRKTMGKWWVKGF